MGLRGAGGAVVGRLDGGPGKPSRRREPASVLEVFLLRQGHPVGVWLPFDLGESTGPRGHDSERASASLCREQRIEAGG